MPVINPWPAIRAVLLALSVLGLVWYTVTLRDENKRLGAAVRGLTVDLATAKRLRQSDQKVAVRYAERVAILTTTQKATDAKLQAAIAANAPWADQNVPADVAAALGMPSPTPAP